MLRLKIARFFPFFIIIIMLIGYFLSNLIDRKDRIYISLNTTTDTVNILEGRTLKRYGNIEVHSVENKKITVNKPDLFINFLAPDSVNPMDNLRILFVIIGGIIFVINFWDFSYQRPFTKQTTLGMRLMTITMFVYISAIFFRNYWLTNYLLHQTGRNFRLETPNIIFSAEFLLTALFLRIIKVFKKGTTLQQEQDLTV